MHDELLSASHDAASAGGEVPVAREKAHQFATALVPEQVRVVRLRTQVPVQVSLRGIEATGLRRRPQEANQVDLAPRPPRVKC